MAKAARAAPRAAPSARRAAQTPLPEGPHQRLSGWAVRTCARGALPRHCASPHARRAQAGSRHGGEGEDKGGEEEEDAVDEDYSAHQRLARRKKILVVARAQLRRGEARMRVGQRSLLLP